MDERKRFLVIAACVFVWAGSLLVWAGWWAMARSVTADVALASRAGQAEGAHRGGHIRIPIYGGLPQAFQPLAPEGPADGTVLSLVYEPLAEERADGALEGVLAEGWRVADDRYAVTVRLRTGARWQDGTPVTAADVAHTYEQLANPSYKGPYRDAVRTVAGVKEFRSGETDTVTGIETGDQEVTFHLQVPFDEAEALLHVPVVPRHTGHTSSALPEGEALADEAAGAPPVGTGPFEIKEMGEDAIELVRFADYWDEALPYAERLTLRAMTVDEAAQAFARGELDVLPHMDASMRGIDAVKSKGTPIKVSGEAYHYVAFNPQQPLWKDEALRRAVRQATRKGDIVHEWLHGYGERVDTPRGTRLAADTEGRIGKKARERLQKERLTLHYSSAWVERDGLAEALREQWKAAGFDVKPVAHGDVAALSQAVQSGRADLFLMTDWVRPDPEGLLAWWTEGRLQEWTPWPGDGLKASLEDAAAESGKERERLMLRWDARFAEEVPVIPLVRPKMLHFVTGRLGGVEEADFREDGIDPRRWRVKGSSPAHMR